MDDLISRRKAIDALGDEPEVWTGRDEYAQGLNNQWHYDRNAIKAVPSAQPQRMKGRWIQISPAKIYECSICGKNVMTSDIDAYDFCHGCGADMRGENDAAD